MIIDSLKKRCDYEALFSDISSTSEFKDNRFQRTLRDLSLHKQHIKALRDRLKNNLNIDASVLRFLKISEKQTIVLKFYIRDLNDYQQAFVKRNNRERFSNTVVCFSDIIIVQDC